MGENSARLAALRRRMRETGTDLVALGPGSHMQWTIGFFPKPCERPCLLLVSGESELILMPALNAQESRSRTNIGFCEWVDAEGPSQALAAALGKLGVASAAKVALDETMRTDFSLLVLNALRQPECTLASDVIGPLRMRKGADDCQGLERSAAIADQAMQAAFSAMRLGMTEAEVAKAVKDHFTNSGATPSFWIVASGENGAFPHHQTGERRLAVGDAVVIDIGARWNSFPSDITRMAVIGEGPRDYERVHAVVEAAVQAGLRAARPGVPAKAVDKAARAVIEEAGYGRFFVHRTGHGMGIDGHEPPYITETSETILEEGMVFSIEPGIYLPGRFGIRLEDIVILRNDGPQILSALTRDVFTVET